MASVIRGIGGLGSALRSGVLALIVVSLVVLAVININPVTQISLNRQFLISDNGFV